MFATIRQRRRRSGFTLIELVIVLLILGISAAVVAPRYASAVVRFRVEAAAKVVAAHLRYARQHAKTKGKTQSVVFVPDTDSYELPGLSDVQRPGEAFSVKLTQTSYPASVASASFGAGGSTVVFDQHGRPDNGGTVVLQVGSEQRTIAVDAISGAVNIQP